MNAFSYDRSTKRNELQYKIETRHTASASMYSLTFRVRVMLP